MPFVCWWLHKLSIYKHLGNCRLRNIELEVHELLSQCWQTPINNNTNSWILYQDNHIKPLNFHIPCFIEHEWLLLFDYLVEAEEYAWPKLWYKAGLHYWYLQCCHYCNTCSSLMPRVLSEKFLMNDKTYNIIIGFGFVQYDELGRSQRVIGRGH